MVLARRWRKGAPLFLALAAVVAFSRMYLDRHWASDVLGAALIGVVGAVVVGAAFSRWRAARVPTGA